MERGRTDFPPPRLRLDLTLFSIYTYILVFEFVIQGDRSCDRPLCEFFDWRLVLPCCCCRRCGHGAGAAADVHRRPHVDRGRRRFSLPRFLIIIMMMIDAVQSDLTVHALAQVYTGIYLVQPFHRFMHGSSYARRRCIWISWRHECTMQRLRSS